MPNHKTRMGQSVQQFADTLAAGTLLVVVFVFFNIRSNPAIMERFMAARITVPNVLLGSFFLLLWQLVFRFVGVYEAAGESFREEARKVIVASSFGSSLALVISPMSTTRDFGWPIILGFCFMTTIVLLGFRGIRRTANCYPIRRHRRQVLIVGSGPRALDLYRELQQKHQGQLRLVGFVDSKNGHLVPHEIQQHMLGSLDELDQILMRRVVDHVFIALPMKSCYDDIQRTIYTCEQAGVESQYLPDVFNLSIAKPELASLESRPVVRLKVVTDDYRLIIKRAIDLIGACVGLILFLPIMLSVAVGIKLTSPGPIFFIQERYGLNKRCFRMWKFRTMVVDAEAKQASLECNNEAQGPVFKIRKDPRITRFGALLRMTSLDELPQLMNVLRGEMSLVGPRPLPQRDVSQFDTPRLMRRFSVKPGLTCFWQISGRSNIPFKDWIRLDLNYIDNWSLTLDALILAKTLPALFKAEGAV